MPGARERLQARGEDVAGDAEVALELGEAADAEERLADDQERPALAEHLHRAADRTGLVLHHVTVSRWRLPVFDGHNDVLLARALVRERSEEGHLDLERARAGGFAGGFFAIFTEHPDGFPLDAARGPDTPPEPPVSHALAHATTLRRDREAARARGAGRAARRARARRPRPRAGGPVRAVMHIEGAEAIDPELEEPARAARARAALARHHVEPAERVRARRAVRGARLARHRPGAHGRRPRARAGVQRARDPRRPRAPQRARVLGRRGGDRPAARGHPRLRARAHAHGPQPHRCAARRGRRLGRRRRRLLPPRGRRPAPHRHRPPGRLHRAPHRPGARRARLGLRRLRAAAGDRRRGRPAARPRATCARSAGTSPSCASSRTRTSVRVLRQAQNAASSRASPTGSS